MPTFKAETITTLGGLIWLGGALQLGISFGSVSLFPFCTWGLTLIDISTTREWERK